MQEKNVEAVKLILERIKTAYNLRSDGALSQFLNKDQSNLSQWKKRNKIGDYELVFRKCQNLNINWLLTGTGEMYLQGNNNEASVDIEEIPKEQFKEWLDDFWASADKDERTWLKVELRKKFPEFAEWVKKG